MFFLVDLPPVRAGSFFLVSLPTVRLTYHCWYCIANLHICILSIYIEMQKSLCRVIWLSAVLIICLIKRARHL